MPQPKPKRRWKLFLLWSLLMFAGGAAAGIALIDPVCGVLDSVASTLGLPAPRFVTTRRAAAPAPSPAAVAPAPAPAPEPAPAAAVPSAPTGTGQVQAAAAKPTAIPTEAKPAPELAAPAAREPAAHEPKGAHHAVAAAPARAEPATEPEPEHAPHGKGATKAASSTGTSGKKSAKFDDPFASDGETANEAKPAAASGKSKASPSEPAPKPTAAKSNDPLDSLMADGVADSKGKKRASKDLDALLKDVQKGNPEPKVKHEDPPPPAAALSPSDISRVMTGVRPAATTARTAPVKRATLS